MGRYQFCLTRWALVPAERSCFLVPRSRRRLPRLVRPLHARGEPLPEDEDRGRPGPPAFCISKVLSQHNVTQLVKNLKI